MEKRSVIGPKELMGSLKHRVQKMLPFYSSQPSSRHHSTRENRCQGMRNVAVVKVSNPQHKTETMLIVSFAVLIFVVFFSSFSNTPPFTGNVVQDAVQINQCGFNRWENGKTHVLTQDLVLSAGIDCLNIQEKQDIVLDCQGHSITTDPAATFRQPPKGIYLSGNRLTVRNCRIANFPWTGISIVGNHTLLEHNTIENNREGVEVAAIPAPRFGFSITSTTLQNNLIQNNVRFGVVMRGYDSIVRGNVIQGNGRTGLALVDTAVVENTVLCNNNRENLPDKKDLKCGGGSNNPSQGQGNFIGTLERCFVLNALAWPTESDYQACDQAPPLSPDVGVPVQAPSRAPRDAACPSHQNTECQEGSVCRKLFVRGDPTHWSGSKYFCKGPMADGGICERNDQCGAGKSCVNQRCTAPQQQGQEQAQQQEQQPPPQAGRACVNNADCGDGLRCLSLICQTRVCSETDGGNDPAVPGVITLDNSITPNIVSQDTCQNDASVLEYFCLPSHESSRQVMMCPGGSTCQTNAEGVGACVVLEAPREEPAREAEPLCTDGDPNDDPAIEGRIMHAKLADGSALPLRFDLCVNNQLVQGYCGEFGVFSQRAPEDCPAGQVCQNGACVVDQRQQQEPAELSENEVCGENIPAPCRQDLLCRKSNPASQTLQCLPLSEQGGFCESTDHCGAGLTCQTGHCLPPRQCRTQADEQAHGGDCNNCVSMPELMRYIAEWNNQDPEQRQLSAIMLVTQGYYDSLADPACQQA